MRRSPRAARAESRRRSAQASISVMPTYLPDLRFVETTHPTRPEVLPLVSRGGNFVAHMPLRSPPGSSLFFSLLRLISWSSVVRQGCPDTRRRVCRMQEPRQSAI